ncbi:MAG TPA: hypothetical protein VG754_14255, partial [Verrucomicrobiae bacterium]|nr:hypothetical protein [Verrucomicrobiae bacterium]
MKSEIKIVLVFLLASTLNLRTSIASAFEGRITATLTRGGETETFLYTIGTNQLRIERSETNWPYPQNLVDLDTGDLTLLFPQNRSFVRLKPNANDASLQMSPFLGMPTPPGGLPPGVGPQTSLPPS